MAEIEVVVMGRAMVVWASFYSSLASGFGFQRKRGEDGKKRVAGLSLVAED